MIFFLIFTYFSMLFSIKTPKERENLAFLWGYGRSCYIIRHKKQEKITAAK